MTPPTRITVLVDNPRGASHYWTREHCEQISREKPTVKVTATHEWDSYHFGPADIQYVDHHVPDSPGKVRIELHLWAGAYQWRELEGHGWPDDCLGSAGFTRRPGDGIRVHHVWLGEKRTADE